MLVLAVSALFRHRQVFLYTVFFTFVAILGVTLMTKKQFRSETKYLVQTARSTSVLSSDRTASSIMNGVSEEQLNSELEILQSEDVLSMVADPAWKPEDAINKSRKELRAHAAKMAKLSSHLTVDPVGKEDVMSVSYRADSAKEANQVLTNISAAYLARHERLRRPPAASSFFAEQTAVYEQQWKAAESRLVAFQQQHHLVNVADVEDTLQKSILASEDAFRTEDLKLQQSDAGLRTAETILAAVPQREQTQQRLVPSELLLQQLKISLVALNNHRTELLTRYKPTDRLVAETERQIADTQSSIDAEREKQNIENTTDVNPTWQQLKTSLVQEEVNRDVLRAGRSALERQLGALRTQLSDTQDLATLFEQLRSQAEQAKANYKAFVDKRDMAQAEDAMDQSKLLNVTVMESPTFPYAPDRPRPLVNILLGIPTALFIGGAVVYFKESGRSTISTPRELDDFSEYPVLATIANASVYGETATGAI